MVRIAYVRSEQCSSNKWLARAFRSKRCYRALPYKTRTLVVYNTRPVDHDGSTNNMLRNKSTLRARSFLIGLFLVWGNGVFTLTSIQPLPKILFSWKPQAGVLSARFLIILVL